MTKTSPRWIILASILSAAAFVTLGCSSSNSGTGATAPVGEVIGPPDNHCSNGDGGLTVQTIGVCQVIDPARVPAPSSTCDVTFNLDAGAGASGDVDASVSATPASPPVTTARRCTARPATTTTASTT